MAILSPNPHKAHLMDYTIGKENGVSEAFVGFLTYLIAKCFLLHDDFLIMDNATIPSRGNARVIEDMLWETMVTHCISLCFIYRSSWSSTFLRCVIVGLPMFLAKDGTPAFDRLKNPLAPLLLFFWWKLSVGEVRKGFTQLIFVQLNGLGQGAVLKLGQSQVYLTQDGPIWNN
jgi:hypothetical protein